MSFSPEFMHQIATAIVGGSGETITLFRVASVGGGDINASYRITIKDRDYFLKTNIADRLFMFEAEMAALNEIARTDTVRVPSPICTGVAEGQAFLVLEWLDLCPMDEAAASRFGRMLAELHRYTAPYFGWHCDNTIGATTQINTPSADWLAFWKEHRLGFQLLLAARKGYGGQLQDLGARLLDHCDELFCSYSPQPSLLHGDLWHGNTASNASGEPMIFDPASYYGDREADLAMAWLFGGFPDAFIAAYDAAWPIDHGYSLRRDFYNVYHLLNHLNLFGKGYLTQAESTMQRVLGKLRN